MNQEIDDAIALLQAAKTQTPEQARTTVDQAIQLLITALKKPQGTDVDPAT